MPNDYLPRETIPAHIETVEESEQARRSKGLREHGMETALRAGDLSSAMSIDPYNGIPARVIMRSGYFNRQQSRSNKRK